MGERNCCQHCETVAHVDGRLDSIAVTLAKLETDFATVRKLVYGAAGLILTAAVTGSVAAAARALGF
jgi:hypothetical protein